MRSLRLLLILLSLPICAQQADLSIELAVAPLVGAGAPMAVFLAANNHGPQSATDVQVTVELPAGTVPTLLDPRCGPVGSEQIRCEMGTMHPHAREFFVLNVTAPDIPGRATLRASIASPVTDPIPANNSVTAATDVIVSADLRIFHVFATPALVDPGEPMRFSVGIGNEGFSTAHDVILTVRLPEGSVFRTAEGPGWNCRAEGLMVTCIRPLLEPTLTTVEIAADAPSSALGGNALARAEIRAATPDPDPANNVGQGVVQIFRLYHVITTADSGDGSLRSAIDAANAACSAYGLQCRIRFDMAMPPLSGGWHTIQPLSELPPLGSGIRIDGNDRIEVNGELAGPANGFVMRGCNSAISNLTINGFEAYGVLLEPLGLQCFEPRTIHSNFIGTDPTGTTAVPNGLRAIGTTANGSYIVNVTENVLSGNVRSGMWIEAGSAFFIHNNRIGVAASSDAPLSNGASGIYVGPWTFDVEIVGNTIAHNAHWGVVVDRRASLTSIRRNSIHSNLSLGIDYGHDYVTPNVPDEVINHPLLASAIYDAASNSTRIEGFLDEPISQSAEIGYFIEFFSNRVADDSGHGEGELFIGDVRIEGGAFTFTFGGDLRGRVVTATATRAEAIGFKVQPASLRSGFFERTSEFSNAIAVTE